MSEQPRPDRMPISATMLALLREEGSHCSRFVDDILDTPGIDGRYGGTDGRATLIEILQSLVVLTGSEQAAVKWLFNSRGYATAVGNDAWLALENGDFWSLALMGDWLRVLEAHRQTCPALIDTIFGSPGP